MNSIKVYYKMDMIFMNSGKIKTPDPHRLLLNLSDKINLKRSDKYVALSNLSTYYTQKNIKKSYNNNKFISPPTWNDKSDLPDGSYSVSDNQDYFDYIIKKHCKFVNNDYQHDSRVLHIFVPNKSFGQLLDISPKKLYF